MTVFHNYLRRQLTTVKIPTRKKSVVSVKSNNFNPELYTNKIMLAPMMTIGKLPTRLLSLRFGADLVYTDEIIDIELLRSKRVVNDAINTIDYVDQMTGDIVFRTCPEERSKVILQVATADPGRAAQCAQILQNDVAGIDVNMGCPLDFSVKRGIGAILMTRPKQIHAILTNLVANSDIPVTCKIRVFPSIDQTLELCEMIQSCGVSALGVHGRTRFDKPTSPNLNGHIKAISETLNIPVIASGGSNHIEKYEDIQQFKEETNCDSVMIARTAKGNPSIFRKEGLLDVKEVAQMYLKLAIDCDNEFIHSKVTMSRIFGDQRNSPEEEEFMALKSMEEICEKWDLLNYYKEAQSQGRFSNNINRRTEFKFVHPKPQEPITDESFQTLKKRLKLVKKVNKNSNSTIYNSYAPTNKITIQQDNNKEKSSLAV